MQFLKRVSLRHKLLFLVVISLGVLVLSNGISYYEISTLSDKSEEVGRVQMAAMRRVSLADMWHDGLRAVVYSAFLGAEANDEKMKQTSQGELKECAAAQLSGQSAELMSLVSSFKLGEQRRSWAPPKRAAVPPPRPRLAAPVLKARSASMSKGAAPRAGNNGATLIPFDDLDAGDDLMSF